MTIEQFEDLEIWQEARVLCKVVFQITRKAPFKKDYKFIDQIRASSGSVMENIAEEFKTVTLSKKIARLMSYLRNSSITGPKFKQP